MDLLLLYHRLPFPPNKGEKTRAYQQVSYLGQHHRLWVACFIDDEQDYAHVPEVRRLCHQFEAVPLNKRLALSRGGYSLLRGRSLTEGYYGHRGMWRILQSWTARRFFDAALAFSTGMAVYVEDLPVGRRVLDLVDLDSTKWADFAGKRPWPMSRMLRVESHRLAARERELIAKFDAAVVVNRQEIEKLTDPQLRERLASFPTLMHLPHYEGVRGIHRDKIVGYVGTMNYPPNIEAVRWFAEQVWSQVVAAHAAQWWIVGRRPPREVQQLAEDPHTTVSGAVEDVRKYLARMRVLAVPILSPIGIPTKVLEALAAGRAVVTTSHGHRAIGGTAGRHYLVADGPGDFAAAVNTLLDDHPRCEELGRGAVAFMKDRYDVAARMPQFEQLLLGKQVVLQDGAA